MKTLGILLMERSPIMLAFWAAELLVHAVGFAVSAEFLVTFFQFPLFHLNFRAIIADLTVSCIFTSACRVVILVGKIWDIFPEESELSNWLQTLRDTGMCAAGMHLVLLSGERAIATIKSRVYEKSHGLQWVVLAVLITWIASFGIVYPIREDLLSQYAAVGIIGAVDGIALVVLFICSKVNRRMYRRVSTDSNAEAQSLSQRYQFSENITSSRLLKRVLAYLAGSSAVGLLSFLGFTLWGNKVVPGQVCGFVFDVTVASLTAFVPIIITLGNPRLRTMTFHLLFPRKRHAASHRATIPVDLDGNRLIIQDETRVYFENLRTSWE